MRRPTAEDRDLADVLRKLKVGDYCVSVTGHNNMMFLGLAKLKIEGSTEITFDDTTVLIVPVNK